MTDSNEAPRKKELDILRTTAVRAAASEILSEHRAEVVKRARAKLIAMGVSFAEAEAEVLDEQP